MTNCVFRRWRTLLATTSVVVAVSLAGAYWPAASAREPQDDDRAGLRIVVEIDGVEAGIFKSVGGLSAETEVIEIQEGGQNIVRKLPGRTKYANITLKRGVLDNGDLWAWHQRIIGGTPEPREAALIILDRRGREVLRYELHNAFPVKWEGPEFDASSNDVGLETIELAVERVDRVGG